MKLISIIGYSEHKGVNSSTKMRLVQSSPTKKMSLYHLEQMVYKKSRPGWMVGSFYNDNIVLEDVNVLTSFITMLQKNINKKCAFTII